MLRKEKREQQERGGGKNGGPRYWQPSTGKASRAEGSKTDRGELSPVCLRSCLTNPSLRQGRKRKAVVREGQRNAAVTINQHHLMVRWRGACCRQNAASDLSGKGGDFGECPRGLSSPRLWSKGRELKEQGRVIQ